MNKDPFHLYFILRAYLDGLLDQVPGARSGPFRKPMRLLYKHDHIMAAGAAKPDADHRSILAGMLLGLVLGVFAMLGVAFGIYLIVARAFGH
jgi:hypothetical protein